MRAVEVRADQSSQQTQDKVEHLIEQTGIRRYNAWERVSMDPIIDAAINNAVKNVNNNNNNNNNSVQLQKSSKTSTLNDRLLQNEQQRTGGP